MPRKLYVNKTVDVALQERLSWIFDSFGDVVVSISGGKDSTVLFEMARREAVRRNRKVHAFFLDQEAEYAATVEHIRDQMARPNVIPHWYQVPVRMTNATSYDAPFLYAWGPGEEWMRPKEADSIHSVDNAPDRFYPFFGWFETKWPSDTAFLVGLRAEEALNRYRAVTRHEAIDGIPWSSRGEGGGLKLYPLYDWTFEDIWTCIGREKLTYNKVYDWMWAKGVGIQGMRVSNLIHEIAFRCLPTLQEFENDTFEALQRRLMGVHAAAIYAGESSVYAATKRPKVYKTWREYRDFLLATMPVNTRLFTERFDTQPQNEPTYRQQCRQLLINDFEGNIPLLKGREENPEETLKKWMEIL